MTQLLELLEDYLEDLIYFNKMTIERNDPLHCGKALDLRQLCHERDELRATSSSLTVELQQAALGIPLVDDDDDNLMCSGDTFGILWLMMTHDHNLILDAIECRAHSLPFMATARAFQERSHGWEFSVILEGL